MRCRELKLRHSWEDCGQRLGISVFTVQFEPRYPNTFFKGPTAVTTICKPFPRNISSVSCKANVLEPVFLRILSAAIRMSSAAHVWLLVVLIVGCFVAQATRHRITVRTYKTNYRIDWWDDGRDDPYRVTYWKFGLKAVYLFDVSGELISLTVRDREYMFPSNIGSRMLLASEQDEAAENIPAGRRRLYPCADCEETWVILCDVGLADVCFLDEFTPDDFNEDAKDSVRRFCSAFGAACETPAFDTCEGQCIECESFVFDAFHDG